MFLLDTNVVSELRKAGSPKVNSGVEQWASTGWHKYPGYSKTQARCLLRALDFQ